MVFEPRLILALWLSAVSASSLAAQDVVHGFRAASLERDGREVRYRILVPDDLADGERVPVLLFLHGAGERGDDNRAQLTHLPERFAASGYRQRYRGIVIAPQCPRGTMWVDGNWRQRKLVGDGVTPHLEDALAILRAVLAEQPVDQDRVYLTGLSMGGFGSWVLAARHPELFAAVAPICGGGDASRPEPLVGLPIWAWHGDADRSVPPDYSTETVAAVRAAGGIAHYTELPGVGHDSWTAAYSPGGVLDWLWQRRRGARYDGWVLGCDQAVPRLVLLDADGDWNAADAVRWQWQPNDDPTLPADHHEWFDHPTDVKPSRLGTHILATASGGGVFVVRMADRTVLFHARPDGNPHSVTELPDGTLVVASSTGNRLTRYTPDPARGADAPPLEQIELGDAHAVHWDDRLELLLALGGDAVVGYRLHSDGVDAGSLTLQQVFRHPLPVGDDGAVPGGHDLAPRLDEPGYLVTDNRHVWLYAHDRDDPFQPAAALDLAEVTKIKSVSRLTPRGALAFVQAGESWWSDSATFLTPNAGGGFDRTVRRLPDARFYKIRFWP